MFENSHFNVECILRKNDPKSKETYLNYSVTPIAAWSDAS